MAAKCQALSAAGPGPSLSLDWQGGCSGACPPASLQQQPWPCTGVVARLSETSPLHKMALTATSHQVMRSLPRSGLSDRNLPRQAGSHT